MAGIVINSKRARYQSNQRFDVGDADVTSRASRNFISALSRALLSTPRATAAAAVGTIISGFSLTLNPTGGADNKVRINTETAVGLDADGGLLIKPAGTTIDTTIPAGQNQLYVYYQETETDNAKRRFIPAASPYTEVTKAINTTLQGTINTYVRAGGIGTVVAEDNVNGVTVPLLLVGIVTNTAGAITCTGYNATTAPNGSDITNRVSVAVPPSTAPTLNTHNGSLQTVQDVIAAALHSVGQAMWKGSDFLTPAAGNNYGAYNLPAGGADKAFRQALGYVTIGNGTTVFGDFNTSDYANSKQLLDAAVASLPTTGGRIVIKRGVVLTGFAASVVTLPASKTVEILGDHDDVPASGAQLVFVASENLTCSATGKLILRNLRINHVGNAVVLGGVVTIQNVVFNNTSTADVGAALGGANVADLDTEDVTFTTNLTGTTNNAMGLRISGTARRVRLLRTVGTTVTAFAGGLISIADVREDVVIQDTTWDTIAAAVGATARVITLSSTDNTTNIGNRRIKGFYCGTATSVGLSIGNTGHLTVEDYEYYGVDKQIDDTFAGAGPLRFTRWKDAAASLGVNFLGDIPDLIISNCEFRGVAAHSIGTVTTGVLGTIVVRDCFFGGSAGSAHMLAIRGNTISDVTVSGCTFKALSTVLLNNLTPAVAVYASGATASVGVVCYVNNYIEDFENIAHGVVNANVPSFFGVLANYAAHVVCQGNTARKMRSGSSGSAHKACNFLFCSSKDGATDAGLVWGALTLTNNVVGDQESFISMLYTTHMFFDVCRIADNTHVTQWNTAAGKPQFATGLFAFTDWPVLGVIVRIVSIANNTSYISNVSNDTVTSAWCSTSTTPSTLTVNSWSMVGNNITMGSAALQVFTLGVISDQLIHDLTIFGNTAARNEGATATAWFKVSLAGAVTRSNPALPGAGNAFTLNNLVHQN